MPRDFGEFSDDVLVGNFGDGHINAFEPSETFLRQLNDQHGEPVTINGLGGLTFGNGFGGDKPTLLFIT